MVVTGEGSVFRNPGYLRMSANCNSIPLINLEKRSILQGGANYFSRFSATSNNTLNRDTESVFTSSNISTEFILGSRGNWGKWGQLFTFESSEEELHREQQKLLSVVQS